MKKALKRIARRIFIIILVVFAVYLLISNIDLIRDLASKEKISVAIDSDAANSPDDLLAMYRIMRDPDLMLRGLTSAQWRLADLDNDSTTAANLPLQNFMLDMFRLSRIPNEEGSPLPLAYTLETGDYSSAASRAIIKITQELPYGEKLNMICLGSVTNLAAAILERPDIADKIICYVPGPSYDPARRAWNKNDPVTRLDLRAMDVLLNEDNLELHMLPANVAAEMFLTREEISEQFASGDTTRNFIRARVLDFLAGTDTLPCPAIAIVEAFRNPDMSTQKQIVTPPENTQRKIYVYTRIDDERMRKEFWKAVNE